MAGRQNKSNSIYENLSNLSTHSNSSSSSESDDDNNSNRGDPVSEDTYNPFEAAVPAVTTTGSRSAPRPNNRRSWSTGNTSRTRIFSPRLAGTGPATAAAATQSTASASCSPNSSPSKSASSKKEQEDLIFDPKALLAMLECPTCHLVPSAPPIFMCQNGHNICGDCQTKTCGICSQSVTDARNFLAEGLLDKLKIKCPNAKDGCTELILMHDKKIHLALCNFRSIVCNQKQEKDCFNVQICFSNYLKHLKKVHKIHGTKDTKLNVIQQGPSLLTNLDIAMAAESWPINYLEVYGHTFLTGTEIADEKIFWWISILGPPEDAEKYIGRISIFNRLHDVEMSYAGPVNEFRRSPAIILEEGSGLVASVSTFRQFTFLRICDVAEDPFENHMRWSVTFSISERKRPYGTQFSMGADRESSQSSSSHNKKSDRNRKGGGGGGNTPRDSPRHTRKSGGFSGGNSSYAK